MSRTSKSRKRLPKWCQRMLKDSGHAFKRNMYLAVKPYEYGDEQEWYYLPLSRHTSLKHHGNSTYDDIETSFYRDAVNWKYDTKIRAKQ